MGEGGSLLTEDADPRRLYQNVLIALDESKGINNGQPSLWAEFWINSNCAREPARCTWDAAQGITRPFWRKLLGPADM